MRMPDLMYFGTKERMTWVRAPDASFEAGKQGWGSAAQFLNGGAFVKRSTASHKTYDLAWTMMSRAEIRAITDYADGLYGTGAIYFLDPMAMDTNLLPQHWATPRQQLEDAPTYSGLPNDSIIRYPTDMTNSLGYPTVAPLFSTSITNYTWPDATKRPSLYVPIPTGYTAWFGAHGYMGGTPPVQSGFTIGDSTGGSTAVPMMDVNNTTRFSNSFDGNTYSYITIGMTAAIIGAALSGVMLQILPTGVAPKTGGFISGQGHGGVRFDEQPALTNVSAPLDRASLTATFTEDELWR